MDITGRKYICGVAQDKNGAPYLFNVGELVRCKDCYHYDKRENEAESWEYCRFLRHNTSDDDFCSWAERRE